MNFLARQTIISIFLTSLFILFTAGSSCTRPASPPPPSPPPPPPFESSVCHYFVVSDKNRSGLSEDGLSWASAFGSLSAAVLKINNDNPSAVMNVCVQKGLFEKEAVTLPQNTRWYGGFVGTEKEPKDRVLPNFAKYDDAGDPADLNKHRLDGLEIDKDHFSLIDGGHVTVKGSMIFDGFILQNGTSTNEEGEPWLGGAMNISGSGGDFEVEIKNTVWRLNKAGKGPNIAGLVNIGSGGSGGAINFADKDSGKSGKVRFNVDKTTFYANEALAVGGAVGIGQSYANTIDVVFKNVVFSNNIAKGDFGSNYGYANEPDSPSVYKGGGAVFANLHGLYMTSPSTFNLQFKNVVFNNNRATVNQAAGNSILASNKSKDGVMNVMLTNVTSNMVWSEDPVLSWWGVYADKLGSNPQINFQFVNSVFWNNNKKNWSDFGIKDYVARDVGSAGGYKPDEQDQDKNHDWILTDSPFVNDYNLNLALQTPTNKCIDHGDNSSAFLKEICSDPKSEDCVDINGNPRIQNGRVDLGAYEYQP